ncbi:NAD-dependent epimerase/dehydratase family protein [Flavobacterium sharifuzzamanii]|uniref:NAD-dependent epimerase/dehydratase family protein n=1 Tax=Flavobacterium sharifuzzamanii TaxID=2211133 RepID=UPI000DAF36FC|nr:NAD-dependent epimerase/dehydratase family protein [Flavobacterium sharifuzzamanii]KAF2081160.1 NAD-dependent epimerase/dehydratase family protein [Flavobacterium sharifuzzamanii]
MKILLTGANGFLGKSIINELSQDNNHIFCLSRTSGDYAVELEKEIPVFKESFDLIIHAAGKAHSVPKSEEEKKKFRDINVRGTANLLLGLEKVNQPKQFVFISSVSVYGQEFGIDIKEDFPLAAKDPYGRSKIEAEKIITDWCKANNIICTILRLPLLVGKNPPGNLGAMIKAIKGGYYFNIANGKARKSMVSIKDVASFISVVAPTGGIFNLTDGIHPSFFELSYAISKKKSFSLPLILAKIMGKIGDLVGDKSPITSSKVKKITTDLTFDDSKARKLLNWKPEPVLNYLKNETF